MSIEAEVVKVANFVQERHPAVGKNLAIDIMFHYVEFLKGGNKNRLSRSMENCINDSLVGLSQETGEIRLQKIQVAKPLLWYAAKKIVAKIGSEV